MNGLFNCADLGAFSRSKHLNWVSGSWITHHQNALYLLDLSQPFPIVFVAHSQEEIWAQQTFSLTS